MPRRTAGPVQKCGKLATGSAAATDSQGGFRGSRNKATIALHSLLEHEGEATTAKRIGDGTPQATRPPSPGHGVVDPADTRAARLPGPSKDRDGRSDHQGDGERRRLEEVAAGKIMPSEGQSLAGLSKRCARYLETEELEVRIRELERRYGNGKLNRYSGEFSG